jgi:hypothetical protein
VPQIAVAFGAATADPLVDKYTEAHITAVIANVDSENRRQWQADLVSKVGSLVVIALVIAAVWTLAYSLINQGQYAAAEKIIIGILGFAAGLGVGLGSRKKSGNKDS